MWQLRVMIKSYAFVSQILVVASFELDAINLLPGSAEIIGCHDILVTNLECPRNGLPIYLPVSLSHK